MDGSEIILHPTENIKTTEENIVREIIIQGRKYEKIKNSPINSLFILVILKKIKFYIQTLQ